MKSINALVESTIGLCKAERIPRRRPRKRIDDEE